MSKLFENAVAEIRQLSDEEQEAIAEWILAEIEDDQRWEKRFVESPNKLTALINRAKEQVKSASN